MSSRVGIVLQAVGVIALGSVVYLAFLSPEDPDPLTGIEVQDGVRITQPQISGAKRSDAERTAARRTGARRHDGPGKPKRNRPRRSATFPRLVATPPPSSEVPPPPVKMPIDTPSGSQYEDAVSRIIGMVGHERRPGEAHRPFRGSRARR